jgi:hypothetical protein
MNKTNKAKIKKMEKNEEKKALKLIETDKSCLTTVLT